MSLPGQHHGPTRTCVGCGRRDAQASLLRLRRDSAGTIAPAQAGAGGRSAYVHRHPECVGGLARSKGLGKSLRGTVTREARLELMQALQTAFSLQPAQPATRQTRHNVGSNA